MQKFRPPKNIQIKRLKRSQMGVLDPDTNTKTSVPAFLDMIQKGGGSQASLLLFMGSLKENTRLLAEKYDLVLIPAKNNSLVPNSMHARVFLTKSEFDVIVYLKKIGVKDILRSARSLDDSNLVVLSNLIELADLCAESIPVQELDLITPELVAKIAELEYGFYEYRIGVPPVSLVEDGTALTLTLQGRQVSFGNFVFNLPESNFYFCLKQFDKLLSNYYLANLGGFIFVIEIDEQKLFMPKIIAEGMINETHVSAIQSIPVSPTAKQI